MKDIPHHVANILTRHLEFTCHRVSVFCIVCGVFVLLLGAELGKPRLLCAFNKPIIHVGKFSGHAEVDKLPSNWYHLTFSSIPNHTLYTLVTDGGTTVVKAASNASASGLMRKISIDPKAYPVITWRWKVENIIHSADATSKRGDDYPARLFVTFEYDVNKLGLIEKAGVTTYRLMHGEDPPVVAINYIWANHLPVGTHLPTPHTRHTQMIVIQSGEEKKGIWVAEKRNVWEDYRTVFGEEPTRITSVGIMTDSDNTGESAQAFYGDIIFRKK